MIGDQNPHAPGAQHLDQLLQIRHRKGVDAGKGFIQKQIRRSVGTRGQCPGHFATATFPPGELEAKTVDERAEVKVLDQLLAPIATLLGTEIGLFKGDIKIFTHREIAKHTGFLGQVTHTKPCSLRHGQMGDPLTVHSHLALIRGEQTNHQVEGGGFSSSIGTE